MASTLHPYVHPEPGTWSPNLWKPDFRYGVGDLSLQDRGRCTTGILNALGRNYVPGNRFGAEIDPAPLDR